MIGRGDAVGPTPPSSATWNGGASSTCCPVAPRHRCGTGLPPIRASPSSAVTAPDPTPRLRAQALRRRCRLQIAGICSSMPPRHYAASSSVTSPRSGPWRATPCPSLLSLLVQQRPSPSRRRAAGDAAAARQPCDSTAKVNRPRRSLAVSGASRNAVRRWIRAGQFVPYRRAPGPSQLDRYISVVEARWQEGQRSATVLHRELRAQGFTGSYDVVRRWAAQQHSGAPARPPSARIPSTRRITRWLTSDPAVLSPEDRTFTETLCKAAPRLKRAAEDVRAFADLLHQDDPTGLTPWLEATGRHRARRLRHRSSAGRGGRARGDR